MPHFRINNRIYICMTECSSTIKSKQTKPNKIENKTKTINQSNNMMDRIKKTVMRFLRRARVASHSLIAYKIYSLADKHFQLTWTFWTTICQFEMQLIYSAWALALAFVSANQCKIVWILWNRNEIGMDFMCDFPLIFAFSIDWHSSSPIWYWFSTSIFIFAFEFLWHCECDRDFCLCFTSRW